MAGFGFQSSRLYESKYMLNNHGLAYYVSDPCSAIPSSLFSLFSFRRQEPLALLATMYKPLPLAKKSDFLKHLKQPDFYVGWSVIFYKKKQ